MWVWRLISGYIVVTHLVELKCGIYHDFLSLESRRHLGLLRSYQKRFPFELALLALFLGFSKTYSGTIAATLIYFFWIENLVTDWGFFDGRYFNFKSW
jgi:hypothetical protein